MKEKIREGGGGKKECMEFDCSGKDFCNVWRKMLKHRQQRQISVQQPAPQCGENETQAKNKDESHIFYPSQFILLLSSLHISVLLCRFVDRVGVLCCRFAFSYYMLTRANMRRI